MSRRTLFLTGHLAEKRLSALLAGLGNLPFAWSVHDIGVQVAALMTPSLIRRRLPPDALGADRVILPGHCRGDLAPLAEAFGVPFERGPEDLHDLPEYLGAAAEPVDLSDPGVRIFAEIVDAPERDVAAILARARGYAEQGADVIDLGCLPSVPFPHMEEAIAALNAAGFTVSIDSADEAELRRGAGAGAAFLLSVSEANLALAEESDAVPVLVPAAPGDLDSLCRAAETLARRGRPFLADPILEPFPFGFTASVLRYAELRRRLPEAPILMGIGNATELMDADTAGVNALLFAIIAELGITDVLAVEKSPHCRSAIREADCARRLMTAAKRLGRLPVGIDARLLSLHERKPFVSTPAEIAEMAAAIRDANFRIETAEDGIHLYNAAGHHASRDPYQLFPALGVERDGAHAFYLGYELARAEIAWRLGKRFTQDEPLDWGAALPPRAPQDVSAHKAPGPTVAARRRQRRTSRS